LFQGLFFRLFGPGFSAAGPPLIALALGELVNTVMGPVATLLMMTDHERYATLAMTLGLLVLVVLDLALIPPFGVVGASIAEGGSVIAWNLTMIVIAERRLKISATALGRRLF
jgi:O-antigen/teichoic acid export membrane protein